MTWGKLLSLSQPKNDCFEDKSVPGSELELRMAALWALSWSVRSSLVSPAGHSNAGTDSKEFLPYLSPWSTGKAGASITPIFQIRKMGFREDTRADGAWSLLCLRAGSR